MKALQSEADPRIKKMARFELQRIQSPKDLAEAQTFRAMCFGKSDTDDDPFDPHYEHVVIRQENRMICACFRFQVFEGAGLKESYSAQHYDLSALCNFPGRLMEIGRFCIHPEMRDPDILRSAWAYIITQVLKHQIQVLFGCSSFRGVDPLPYTQAFSLLGTKHLAPERWAPKQMKSGLAVPLRASEAKEIDLKSALSQMPPLLRSYLTMGGWVSDHAIKDHKLNTLHVFTGLEVDKIPKARRELLQRMAYHSLLD